VNQVVLGVDPGSRHTGYGIIQGGVGGQFLHLASGQINAGAGLPLETRLCRIYDGLEDLIRSHRPDAVAVEDSFLATNVKSAFILGQVRGVVLLLAAKTSLPIFQYPPLVVKKAVVGYGQATKDQVQLMMEQMLGLKLASQHAADALAVSLCHFFHRRWPGGAP
jgi:crossover junction endodeoxyribonuclease RuvC